MFFRKEHTSYFINYAIKINACCILHPVLLLFLVAGGRHFAEVQSSHFFIKNSPHFRGLKNYLSLSAIKMCAAMIRCLGSEEGCSN